jgi:hypothetical protein
MASFGLALAGMLLQPQPVSSGPLEVKDTSGNPLFSYRSSFALVIWAGDYRNPFWAKLNNLRAEAAQVEEALKRQNFQVTVVVNPTALELRSSMETFIQRYGFMPDSRLVIYFAGHGWTRNNDLGYLVPVDAPDASTVEGDLDFAKNALSMEQILSWSKQMEAKHVLFIFDSCFSGSVFKARSGTRTPPYLERKMSLPVREFLTAGDANEKVPARSIFTPLLVRGLDGAADINQDGYITGSELGEYLPQAMAEYTTTQNPQYGKIRDPRLDEGDIVFQNPSLLNPRPEGMGPSTAASSFSPTAPLASPPVPSPARPAPSVAPAKPTTAPLPPIRSAAISTPSSPSIPLPSLPGGLRSVSAESILDAGSAESLARERLPEGAIEQKLQCKVVNVASTDHHRCIIWYLTPPTDR